MQYYFPNRRPDPDPQMFLFMKKRLYGPFSWMGLNHFEGVVYFLPLSSQKLLVRTHFLSTSKGRTMQIPKSDPKKGVYWSLCS